MNEVCLDILGLAVEHCIAHFRLVALAASLSDRILQSNLGTVGELYSALLGRNVL